MEGHGSVSSSTRLARQKSPIDLAIVLVGLVAFALDQITKHQVVLSLGPTAPRNSVEVLGSYVRLAYTTNSGAAFGLFPERTVVITAVALVAVPLLVFSRLLFTVDSPLVRFSLGLLLGGALGNLVDRVRLGYVVDFVDVGINQTRWPSFNVADSSFVIGVAILIFYMLFLAPDEGDGREAARTEPEAGPSDQIGRRSVP